MDERKGQRGAKRGSESDHQERIATARIVENEKDSDGRQPLCLELPDASPLRKRWLLRLEREEEDRRWSEEI